MKIKRNSVKIKLETSEDGIRVQIKRVAIRHYSFCVEFTTVKFNRLSYQRDPRNQETVAWVALSCGKSM